MTEPLDWKPAVTVGGIPFGPWRVARPEMRRCRVCGSLASVTDWGTGLAYSVGCDNHCTSTEGPTPEEAVRQWNAAEKIFDLTDPATIAAIEELARSGKL